MTAQETDLNIMSNCFSDGSFVAILQEQCIEVRLVCLPFKSLLFAELTLKQILSSLINPHCLFLMDYFTGLLETTSHLLLQNAKVKPKWTV